MEKFKVSVIIPVYNAKEYLRNSVESAQKLVEVGEIILIEDGSPDNALELCRKLEKEYSKVRCLCHSEGKNLGAGASRNLGISNSKFEFIAFLDADDWYLPNRFKSEKELFVNPDVDGVYGATGYYVEGSGFRDEFKTCFNDKVHYKDVLYYLVSYKGHFHTNAITIRKSIFEKTGKFDANLKLHQDTHFWYKLAHFGKLEAGQISKNVAVRREHAENRICNKNKSSRRKLHQAVFSDFKNYKNVDKRAMRIIINRFVHSKNSNKFYKLAFYCQLFFKNPSLIKMIT